MKKGFKILFAILAIVLIIVGIVLFFLTAERDDHEGHTHGDDEFEDEPYLENEEEENKIMPYRASQIILNYQGEWDREDLYESIYKIASILPEFIDKLQNINEEDLEQYFDNNEDYIYENFGIQYSKNFVELANYLKEFNNIGEYKKSEIIDGSIIDTDNYFKFKLLLTFENEEGKESEILLMTSFSNYIYTEPEFIYKKSLFN